MFASQEAIDDVSFVGLLFHALSTSFTVFQFVLIRSKKLSMLQKKSVYLIVLFITQ